MLWVLCSSTRSIEYHSRSQAGDIIRYIIENVLLKHGRREIRFFLFCRTVEWPSGNDGFHHWPRYWAADWPEHPASDWTWLNTCRIPTFGCQRTVLAITDSFSLDHSSQRLGWEPTRLATIFGYRFKPWTTTSRRFLWEPLADTQRALCEITQFEFRLELNQQINQSETSQIMRHNQLCRFFWRCHYIQQLRLRSH